MSSLTSCSGDIYAGVPMGLRRLYGKGRWRKMKGVARVRLQNGRVHLAERHRYEAHGIGRKDIKRKRNLD